ncbi:MAG: TonB-dependent receptor [Sphingomonas bacterium]|uniref:TonB-dependent receptor n=1 Tax=Sphingomonas bacterium TaxID=1895847 RepID=UPI0026201691|nr:TonB-dependent receptor [Sphingomonas bacterium]MDB5704766.1 TonB-dependent receptor [Sphingomonas bacterium]
MAIELSRIVATRRFAALGALLLAGTAWPALAQTAPAAPAASSVADEASDDIVVTGYRESLQSSTNAKRNSTGFSDTIFAEDIGKFPDTNIAETFNRIPGITISRETTGEGLNIAIRGLGTNFTKVLLNGAPVAIASTGRTDAQSTNREVDLDLFPIELFTQLTVNKTQAADMVEGGTSGVVNMRSARPFDNPGTHLTYSLSGVENTSADKLGARGSIIASGTFGDFGILVGAAGFRNKVRTVGYETIGLTNPNLSAAQFGAATGANATGGGNWTIPGTVPANAGNGLVTGATIDQAFLLAQNPGANISQIDNGLIPRLGRPSDEFGTKDRYNFIASLEYRPSDDIHLYVDGMYGRKKNNLQRIDMNWVGRNGAAIPLKTTYDRSDCTAGCVVTKGTYANAQFFLEYRPFIEDTEFWGINPGGEWTISDNLKLNLQANYTKSKFHRESPTVLVITPASSGLTVNYDYNNGGVPIIGVTGANLNDPAAFGWNGGRVNIQDEKRRTETKGIHGDLTWGDKHLSLKVGGAYDDVSRRIQAFDNSQAWQNAVCGDNPSIFVPSPNTQPPCLGQSIVGSPATLNAADSRYPLYPGYGTYFTQGATTPYTYRGSLIPQSALAGFLMPGPDGFITVDWNKFKAASNYDAFHDSAPEGTGSNTGASGGYVREKTTGAFAEVNGDVPVGDNQLQFNAGVRWVHTNQTIGGFVSLPDPRNTPPDPDGAGPLTAPVVGDGGKYPNIVNFVYRENKYDNWLPSVSAAFHIGDSAVARASVSRTMTRPDPNAQLPGLSFSSPSADVGSIGNSALEPYLSTNFDVGFEYYTGKEGYVGVAAFRKAVTGFTTNGTTTLPFSALAAYGVTYDTLSPTQQQAITARGGPGTATVVIQQQVNASGTLKINGLEFNWVQPLDFLLGKYLGLNGFGFQANLTLIDQKGAGAASTSAVALGVAPVSYNITAYYEGHGLTVRASTTFNQGSQSSGTNQNGIPLAALFTDDYQQYDLSSSLDLNKVFGSQGLPQITFDVVNIFNAEQRSYFQFPGATFTSYKPGTTFLVGLRGRF